MIYGRMWLVVKPSLGIPMGAVAIMGTSLAVHTCILTHTTWFPAFLQGGVKAQHAVVETGKVAVAPQPPVSVASTN